MKVIIATTTVGQHFASIGLVIDYRTRRIIHRCGERPYGFIASCVADAVSWAEEHNHRIVEDEDR